MVSGAEPFLIQLLAISFFFEEVSVSSFINGVGFFFFFLVKFCQCFIHLGYALVMNGRVMCRYSPVYEVSLVTFFVAQKLLGLKIALFICLSFHLIGQ